MSYTPKTEAQLAEEGLLSKGEYDCEVVETSDKPSKSGNEMITLKHHVFDKSGNARIVYDYIVFGNNFGERKFRHAAAAFGLIAEYESGGLKASDFMGKCGRVEIKIQEGNADYPLPKNAVADYIAKDGQKIEKKKVVDKSVEEDEVPF